MRRLTVEIEGGNAEEQADMLRRMAWTVEHGSQLTFNVYDTVADGTVNVPRMKVRILVVDMAEYDREILAGAWFRSRFRSHNALARATNIADDRLALILLGENRATVKELDAICEELGISVESLSATEETSDVDTQ